jgi:hypothetical protein
VVLLARRTASFAPVGCKLEYFSRPCTHRERQEQL